MPVARLVGVIVVAWLVIGAVAVWQRGYFDTSRMTCASSATIALTTLAGPLNYAGFNPVVGDCRLPTPSSTGAIAPVDVRRDC